MAEKVMINKISNQNQLRREYLIQNTQTIILQIGHFGVGIK